MTYHIVVCAGLVPDPLQALEPITATNGPALKNEAMLPAVLDPWGAHALYEAANLARQYAGTRVWLASLAPRPKLQQVMMTIGQKAPFELLAIDGPASGFTDAHDVAAALAEGIAGLEGLDRERLLLFGGWESASRAAGTTLQMVGERLGLVEQFHGVDALTIDPEGRFEILERVEGGQHQVSTCTGPPVVVGWATGYLREPPNNPQVGMANMRSIMPSLQRARAVTIPPGGVFERVAVPPQRRETRVVKDMAPDDIAKEIVEWIRQ